MLRLALPITLGQLAIVGMSITDILIAGRLSTNDLAAVSLGSTIFNLSIMLVIGIILGNGPVVGHLFGAGQYQSLGKQLRNCLMLSLPLGLGCAALIFLGLVIEPLLDSGAEVSSIVRRYLLPMAGSAFLLPFIMTFRTTLESIGHARPAMVFNLLGFVLNIPLDYALVHGRWGLPQLGGAGCGWATLSVSLFIVVGQCLYTRYGRDLQTYGLLRGPWTVEMQRLREVLRIGLPIGGAILAEGGFFLLIPLLIAHLGAVVVSGHSVAIYFDWMMFMVPMGIAQAITVLASHQLGGGRADLARRVCFTGLGLTSLFAICQAVVVLTWREQIAAVFTPDPAVRDLAALLLGYAAIFRLFDAINVGGNGALRAYKDTRITVILAITGYWLIGFPLSYSLALTDFWTPQLGVEGFWIGIVVALVITSAMTTTRVVLTSRQAVQSMR